MIIVLKRNATDEQLQHIVDSVKGWGLTPSISRGIERTVIGVIGDEDIIRSKPVEIMPGVESVMPVLKPYKLASAESRPEKTKIILPLLDTKTQPVEIGADKVVVIAGPCSVENKEMLSEAAHVVKAAGASILRGGAFKPRTSPYSFQGLGEEGIRYLQEVREETGMPFVTEVMNVRQVDMVAEKADMLQIGARNMQNFDLLKEVGKTNKPVIIKRGLSSTLEELLMSAEYVLSNGNAQVILCERGIRTFETFTRNTLDISAVPVLKRETHLPIIVDPSHGTGHWDLVAPLARAAVAAGADGLMLEVHPNPESAFSDGPQSLLPATFVKVMKDISDIARAIGRRI